MFSYTSAPHLTVWPLFQETSSAPSKPISAFWEFGGGGKCPEIYPISVRDGGAKTEPLVLIEQSSKESCAVRVINAGL